MRGPNPRPSEQARSDLDGLPAWLRNEGAWQLLIGAVAIAVYSQTIGFGWVYDDQMEIVRNLHVHSLRRIPDIFSSTIWAGSGMETFLYRPLASVTYALNHQLSGLLPWSYHLVNVLLHAVVSVLVFRLGRFWGVPALASGLGGLLFAVHPVHVEVAAAVYGRKDLLAAFFVLIMTLSHRPALRRGGWLFIPPIAAYMAALLSKEVGIIGLALVAAHDWLQAPDRRALLRDPRVPLLYAGYLAALSVYFFLRTWVTGGLAIPGTSILDNPLVAAEPFSRAATILVVLGRGVVMQAVPWSLSPDYSFNAIPLVRSVLDWRFLVLLAVLVGSTLGLARGAGRIRAVRLALAWYLVTIFPTSNALITIGTIFGERLLYLPSVSLCLLAGVGLAWGVRKMPRAALLAVPFWMGLMVAQTVRYSAAWKDDISLFRWATEHVPNSTKAHHKMGEELLRRDQLGDAVRSLRRSLEIAPDNEFASVTLGIARERIRDRYLPPPGPGTSVDAPPSDPDVLYVLGQLSRERGDLEEAKDYWEEVLRWEAGHPESLADLGVLRIAQGDTTTALDYLARAVQGKPSLASAWFNLGRIRLARGERAQAREALEQFVRTADASLAQQVDWARDAILQLGGR